MDLCRKYKESATVINAVESHHGDVEPETLIACVVQAADTISAARPGARRETIETYTNRLKQLEDISNQFKGVEKSFAIQAGREIRIMVCLLYTSIMHHATMILEGGATRGVFTSGVLDLSLIHIFLCRLCAFIFCGSGKTCYRAEPFWMARHSS